MWLQTATLLNHIYHLPIYERMLIVERTIHSIRKEQTICEPEIIDTHFASEQTLAKDWINPIEDKAWKDL
jgi:hypothetical protein